MMTLEWIIEVVLW